MKRGPKRKAIEDKKTVGSYRPSRDAPTVPISTNAAPPKLPRWLSAEAKAVWKEELPRVIEAGTTISDTALFADYCQLSAAVRAVWQEGGIPQGNHLVELRKLRELLGIGGAPSRRERGTKAQVAPDNPFARLIGGE